MGALDKSIGALLIGTWANGCLYALEILSLYRYFSEQGDDLTVQVAVLAAFAVDTVCTFGFWAGVYEYAITHWGDATYLDVENFMIPAYCIGTGLSAGIVQLFLIARAGRLIKSNVVRTAILVALGALSLTSTGCAIWTGVTVKLNPTYSGRAALVIPVTVWLTTSVGADIAIAVTLLWQLLTVRKTYTVENAESRLAGVLQRLILTTIETGSATASIAILTLATYLADPASNVTVGLGIMLGRVYTLTMLYNLNSRSSISSNTGGASSSGNGARRFRFSPGTKKGRQPGIMVDGIQVNHVATVHVDEPIHLDSFRQGEGATRSEHSKVDIKDDSYTTIGV